MLSREARQAKAQQKMPRAAPDFAASYPHRVDQAALASRIIRRVNNDPFVDAYVRWQLLSFTSLTAPASAPASAPGTARESASGAAAGPSGPALPTMTDEQFEQVLSDLPALIDNPRADSVLIADLNSAARGNPLDTHAQAFLQRRIKQMDDRTARIEAFNRAPLGLRLWLGEQVATDKNVLRPMLAAIEEVVATISAGWNAGAARQRFEGLVQQAARDQILTEAQRELIAEKIENLNGRKNMYVRSARIEGDNVIVEYADTAVDDFEVRKWVKMVKREAIEE